MFTEACQATYEASKPKVQRTPIERDRYGAHDHLVMAYFFEHLQYDEATFRERFRMSRRLFTKIVREVTDASLFFQQRDNYTEQRDISSLMKCTSVIRQMAYGSVLDSLDEHLQIGATTARKSLQIFCKVIMNLYGEEFLRKPTYTDMENSLLITMKSMGFLGWRAPDVAFMANNVLYKRGYYLTDGIYSQWSVLIKSIKNTEGQHRDDDLIRTHEESMQVTQEIIDRTAHLSSIKVVNNRVLTGQTTRFAAMAGEYQISSQSKIHPSKAEDTKRVNRKVGEETDSLGDGKVSWLGPVSTNKANLAPKQLSLDKRIEPMEVNLQHLNKGAVSKDEFL
ncbi:ALP1-like protein, partial [Tanacetum coccineum]